MPSFPSESESLMVETDSGHVQTSLRARVFQEQIRQLYRQAGIALVGMPLGAVALTYVLADEVPAHRLALWLGVVFVLTLVRTALMVAFRRRRPDPAQTPIWARTYLALELAAGLVWGTTGLALGLLEPLHQLFAAFVVAGMMGGAAAILAPYLPAAFAFVLPAGILFATGLHTLDLDTAPVMSALTFLYGAVMLAVAWLMNRQIREAIALRFHNADLLEALRQSNRQLNEEIRERVAASQHLERSRAELRAILDNMQDVFFRTDTQGRLSYVTPSVSDLLGIEAHEAFGQPVERFQAEPGLTEDLLRRLQDQGGMVSNHEVRLRHGDGHTVWASVNAQFYYDDKGNVRGVEGTLRDVTERRRAMEAAYKAKEDYRRLWEFNRTILDNSPVGIIRLDRHLRIMYMNPEMRRITGVPEGQESAAIGEAIHQLPTVSVTGLADALTALTEGRHFSATTPYTSIYGRTTYIEVQGMPLLEGGRFEGAVLVVRDVTEQEEAAQALRRARDQAEAANRAKTTFLANASHELRTPLTGILGALDLLRRSELSDHQRRLVELAEESTRHLARLVDDLLQLSRSEAGKPPRWTPIDPAAALHEDTALLALQAQEKGLDFHLRLAADLPEVVYADRQWLRQIITNLVANAVKFTEEGAIAVSLQVDHYSRDKAHLHLTVADTGIGIPAQDRERIFEPFTQLDDGSDRAHGGTGLGTTIVRELVRRLDGKVWVESEPGRGSRFHVLLPLPMRTEDGAIPESDDARTTVETDADERTPLNILLVEDNPINQMVVKELLEGLGHRVTVAEDGNAGVERWSTGRFDVILMDAQMPGMDGYTAAREIRRREKESDRAAVPIVALTAHASDEDRAACLAAGMDAYLTKPLSIDELDRTLRRIAARRGQPRLRLVKT